MKKLCSVLILFCAIPAFCQQLGQNLIPNANFQLGLQSGGTNIESYQNDWRLLDGTTADLTAIFDASANDTSSQCCDIVTHTVAQYNTYCSGYGVPDNTYGCTNALVGDRYAGLKSSNWGTDNAQIGVELLQPLKPGFEYELTVTAIGGRRNLGLNTKLKVRVGDDLDWNAAGSNIANWAVADGNNWQVFTTTITVTEEKSHLLLKVGCGCVPFVFPFGPNLPNDRYLHLQRVQLVPVSIPECQQDVYVQNHNFLQNEVVTAANLITTVGDVAVPLGADVDFYAGNEVLLTDGFIAVEWSSFDAEISQCTPSGKLVDGQPISETSEQKPLADPELTVSPIPATTQFLVSTTQELERPVNLILRNSLGRQVMLKSGVHLPFQMQVAELSPGVYYLSVSEDGFNKATKVLILD